MSDKFLDIEVWQVGRSDNGAGIIAKFALPGDAQAFAEWARSSYPLVDFEIRKAD